MALHVFAYWKTNAKAKVEVNTCHIEYQEEQLEHNWTESCESVSK